MCHDIWIDVTDKKDSEKMVSPAWKTYFKLIAKDYPGYEKLNILNDGKYYTLKGYLVDGEDPRFFQEIQQLMSDGVLYILERFRKEEENGTLHAPF